MKTLGFLLLLSSFAWANTISLTSGHGILTNQPSATFSLSGPGFTVTSASFSDDLDLAPGLHQCNAINGCNLGSYGVGSILLFQAGVGTGMINGVQSAWDGSIHFQAISFHSSLLNTGQVAINYLAQGSVLMLLCEDLSCGTPTGITLTMSKNWRVHALFDPVGGGGFVFHSATFAAVPEPGTLALVIPGLLLVVFLRLQSLTTSL